MKEEKLSKEEKDVLLLIKKNATEEELEDMARTFKRNFFVERAKEKDLSKVETMSREQRDLVLQELLNGAEEDYWEMLESISKAYEDSLRRGLRMLSQCDTWEEATQVYSSKEGENLTEKLISEAEGLKEVIDLERDRDKWLELKQRELWQRAKLSVLGYGAKTPQLVSTQEWLNAQIDEYLRKRESLEKGICPICSIRYPTEMDGEKHFSEKHRSEYSAFKVMKKYLEDSRIVANPIRKGDKVYCPEGMVYDPERSLCVKEKRRYPVGEIKEKKTEKLSEGKRLSTQELFSVLTKRNEADKQRDLVIARSLLKKEEPKAPKPDYTLEDVLIAMSLQEDKRRREKMKTEG